MLWREILYLWKKRHQRNVVQLMNVINIIIGVLLMAFVNNEIAWIMVTLDYKSEAITSKHLQKQTEQFSIFIINMLPNSGYACIQPKLG